MFVIVLPTQTVLFDHLVVIFCISELCRNYNHEILASCTMAGKKVSHHLNVSVKKALITHLDFDVTQK
jgi:hypothetical protein